MVKTFVADNYQISLGENGSFEVRIKRYLCDDLRIIYNPDNKEPWAKWYGRETCETSQSITGLWLSTTNLETLHEALEVVGKQDLMDNEIVFVNNKTKEGN